MTTPGSLRFSPPVGDGPFVVLGHSLGTSARLWRHVVPRLTESFTVVCWELPGHGSTPATGPLGIAEMSDAVAAHLDALGAGRFLHAGVSIGGVIGIDLADRHAERLAGSVVVSAAEKVDAPDFWFDRARAVRANGTESLMDGSRQRWFAPQTLEQREELVADTLAELGHTDDASYAWAAEALAAYDGSDRLASIAVPVLAVAGQHDQAVPEQRSQALAKALRYGSFVRISDAAHTSPVEQPEAVAAALLTFAREVTGRP